LGKTIEVGVLLAELIRRGKGQRILEVAIKSILAQLQAELWARFTIPLVRLDSVGIQRVQAKIPSNQNPFHYFDKVIVSIDTLKKDARYRRFLEDCQWDVVVVDECQNVAERGTRRSQRARLARLLARNTDGLVFTSATPHDGRPESFASLMRLLEPTAIADDAHYTAEDVRELFVRRFQKDVRHTAVGSFHERDVALIEPAATPAEDRALGAIAAARFRTIGRSRNTDPLFRTLVLKAWLSSPAACLATLQARERELERAKKDPADVAHDRALIADLGEAVGAVSPDEQSKLQALFSFLEDLGYAPGRPGARVVLFSERLDTLRFLSDQLAARFGLAVTEPWREGSWRKGPIASFHGGLADQEQYALVQDFASQNGAIRLLLCSDAAAEGLNLHHACHHLVHYDVPWSLITLEQRNGRIDRFGQTAPPVLRYLLTAPGDPALQGDRRILRRLVEKETEASRNLGDVAWLMNLHDPEREEARIARAIEEQQEPDAPFAEAADDAGEDWLQALLAEGSEEASPVRTADPASLFPDDLAYAREAFTQLGLDGAGAQVEWFEAMDGFRLRAPPDLQLRYRYLPPELRRGKDGEVQLSVDRQRVMDAYARARDDEDGWPEWELLWELHPVAEWLNDRVLASFRRHEAPVVEVGRGLDPGEAAYVLQTTQSNQRSQPVLVDWSAVRRAPLGTLQAVPLLPLAEACGLGAAVANSGRALDTAALQRDLPRAVRLVRERAVEARKAYEQHAAEELRPAVRKLRQWQAVVLDRLRQQAEAAAGRAERLRQLEHERAEVEAVYQARHRWISESVNVSPTPYVRLAAVLVRP
ncbi:MAG: DEAD/DEAH box helicase, partial [Thermoanaerobaculia bacterium]